MAEEALFGKLEDEIVAIEGIILADEIVAAGVIGLPGSPEVLISSVDAEMMSVLEA